ncbi:MAG: hypothetical protein HY985_04890 [Magnetospirillum sp.]|nr:hypothetical protein [Magnetospirillum sp.]
MAPPPNADLPDQRCALQASLQYLRCEAEMLGFPHVARLIEQARRLLERNAAGDLC